MARISPSNRKRKTRIDLKEKKELIFAMPAKTEGKKTTNTHTFNGLSSFLFLFNFVHRFGSTGFFHTHTHTHSLFSYSTFSSSLLAQFALC